MHRLTLFGAGLLAALGLTAACGDGSDSSDDGGSGASTTTTSSSGGGSSSSGGAGGMGAAGGAGGEGGCTMGLSECAGECFDLDTDPNHCGDCDTVCSDVNTPASCSDGMCVLMCAMGFDDCDMDVTTGCETNLAESPMHCGACNTTVPEICDGLDNDCDTASDNGCPDMLSLANGGFGMHGQFGNLNGGSAFSDVCPAGQALYRFSGNVGGNIDRLRGHCAPLVLNTDMSGTPYSYSITRGAVDTPLPFHGGNMTTPFDVSCTPNAFVVGITGEASGGGLHQLTLLCAQLLISGEPGAWMISYSPILQVNVSGTNAGTAYMDLLAAPKLADRFRGRSGAWIDAIGIGEADATLTLLP